MAKQQFGIALLGCGIVGGGVANILLKQREVLKQRTGVDLQLRHVVVKSEAEYPPNAAELERLLTTISVPTLVIWGAEDRIIPVRFANRLRDDVPGATVKILQDTGHAPQEERPEITAAILLEFLATLR